MQRRTYSRLLAAAAVAITVAAVAMLVGNDSHRGARYLAWRYCRIGDWRYGVRFLNVDRAFRASLGGLPRAELVKWFPDLRPGLSRPSMCPTTSAEYERTLAEQRVGEWIGDTPWLVVYDGTGRVRDIMLPKGC